MSSPQTMAVANFVRFLVSTVSIPLSRDHDNNFCNLGFFIIFVFCFVLQKPCKQSILKSILGSHAVQLACTVSEQSQEKAEFFSSNFAVFCRS